MLKKTVAMVALSVFAVSSLTACGSSTAPILAPEVDNSVQSESVMGVAKIIQDASTHAFKELDKDKNKMITPEEYGVATPDSAKAFYALDDNHDGKITLKEMMPGFFKRIGLNFRLRSAASSLFKQLDTGRDGYISHDELSSGLVSTAFNDMFKKYDKEKPGKIFNKGTKDKLSKSEFENVFADIAMNHIPNTPPAPPPAPADPAAPAPAPADPAAPASPAPAAK